MHFDVGLVRVREYVLVDGFEQTFQTLCGMDELEHHNWQQDSAAGVRDRVDTLLELASIDVRVRDQRQMGAEQQKEHGAQAKELLRRVLALFYVDARQVQKAAYYSHRIAFHLAAKSGCKNQPLPSCYTYFPDFRYFW